MFQLESVLIVIDKLLGLVGEGKRGRRELFVDVVEPLFNDVQPVVDEYFSFFRGARRSVQRAGDTRYDRLVKELTASRKDLLTVRIRVTELAKALRKRTRVAPVRAFAGEVEGFFAAAIYDKPVRSVTKRVTKAIYDRPTRSAKKKATKRKALIRKIEHLRQQPIPAWELVEEIDRILEEMEESWTKIATAYAAARVHCLGR